MAIFYNSVLEALGKAKPPMGYKGAISNMESLLEPDEKIVFAHKGNLKIFNTVTSEELQDGSFVLFCVTTERLLCTGLLDMDLSLEKLDSVGVGSFNSGFEVEGIPINFGSGENLVLNLDFNEAIYIPVKEPEKVNATIDFLNDLINKRPTVQETGYVDTAEELRKFKQLEADGIITAEEFETKKKELLGF